MLCVMPDESLCANRLGAPVALILLTMGLFAEHALSIVLDSALELLFGELCPAESLESITRQQTHHHSKQ